MCTIYISHFEQTADRKYRTEHSAGLRLLSAALDDCFGIYIPAENLPAAIRTGTYGKPELISHPDIHFNISHSEDIAACALSRQEIGVDIEKIQPFREICHQKSADGRRKGFSEPDGNRHCITPGMVFPLLDIEREPYQTFRHGIIHAAGQLFFPI